MITARRLLLRVRAIRLGWLVTLAPATLFVVALLLGYAGLAIGIAAATGHGEVVYPIAIGLFLLSCCGWKVLWTLATQGLYALSRGDDR